MLGANLSVANGTISAASSPFNVAQLPSGVVPTSNDQVPVSQAGTNAAVTYRQLMSGLPSVPNIDGSQLVVLPTGSKSGVRLGDLASNVLSLAGGTMTGSLGLQTDPITVLQAATKGYVDGKISSTMPILGGSFTGPISLTGDPSAPQHASTKNYVDSQVGNSLAKSGGSMSGYLTLYGDPTLPLHSATRQYVDTRVNRAGDTLTGLLTLSADPTASAHAATKRYVDAQAASSLSNAGGSLSGALILNGDPTLPLQAASKRYADSRIARTGDTLSGPLILAGDPTASTQAATKNYVDVQDQSALPRSGGTMTGTLVLSGSPNADLQAATKQYVDTRVLRAGDTLTGPLGLVGEPTTTSHASNKGYVDGQIATALAKSGGSLTGPLTLNSDPSVALHAATKQYVDTQIGGNLPRTGGTLAGPLTLANSPTTGSHAATKSYVDTQVGGAMPLTGGTFTGTVTGAAAPTAPLHLATKGYVDANPGRDGVINVKLPPYNAALNGITDDTSAFKNAYVAAPAGSAIYVPNGIANIQHPGSWGVSLTKRVKWIIDGTTLLDGSALATAVPFGNGPTSIPLPGFVSGNTPNSVAISQANSQDSDFAVLQTSYVSSHSGGSINSVICNARSDTIIYNSPRNFIWGGLDRLIWAGTQTPVPASPAQHVGRYVQTIRQSASADANGQPLPQPELWAACLEYRDATGKSSNWAGDSLVVEMDWIGNGSDESKRRQMQSLVVAQHDPAGAPVEVSTIIGVYLGAGSTGKTYTVFNVGIPFSNAVLDTTHSQQLSGASAIRLAAGHSISFEASGSNRLAYDSTFGTLRWYQGPLSYAVGKGISVGWQNVCSGNTTLQGYLAGNIIFLVGSGNYTITLPSASTVLAGTGFTFSALTNGVASIAPANGDVIDLYPVQLRQHDRLHIVSDGANTWREVFRTNSMGPRFGAPPILPSYTVATLPASPGAGAKAFATNGRKPNETTGTGTGVEVFHDGTRWVSGCSGTPVAA